MKASFESELHSWVQENHVRRQLAESVTTHPKAVLNVNIASSIIWNNITLKERQQESKVSKMLEWKLFKRV